MSKKLDLHVIGSKPLTGIEPRRPLGERGSALWRQVLTEYRIEDIGTLEALQIICEASDLIATLQDAIRQDGCTIRSRNGIREHPAVKQVIAAMAFVTRNLRALNLDVEPVGPVGRPTKKGGW
jgi:Phage terminase, small subunit